MKKEPIVYLGEAQLLMQEGALPLTFEIKAGALGEATEKVAGGAKAVVERAVKGLQEMRREAASPIIIPDRLPPGLGGPGGPRRSGRIQWP
jgi:hypothetical protein